MFGIVPEWTGDITTTSNLHLCTTTPCQLHSTNTNSNTTSHAQDTKSHSPQLQTQQSLHLRCRSPCPTPGASSPTLIAIFRPASQHHRAFGLAGVAFSRGSPSSLHTEQDIPHHRPAYTPCRCKREAPLLHATSYGRYAANTQIQGVSKNTLDEERGIGDFEEEEPGLARLSARRSQRQIAILRRRTKERGGYSGRYLDVAGRGKDSDTAKRAHVSPFITSELDTKSTYSPRHPSDHPFIRISLTAALYLTAVPRLILAQNLTVRRHPICCATDRFVFRAPDRTLRGGRDSEEG